MNHGYAQFSSLQQSLQQQKGVVIVVALITLLVMTVVGLTTIGTATLQERMAANNKFYYQARLNAEAALRGAEDFLANKIVADPVAIFRPASIKALADNKDYVHLALKAPTETAASTNAVSEKFDLSVAANWAPANFDSFEFVVANAATNPRFVIEYIGFFKSRGGRGESKELAKKIDDSPQSWAFRISAIGYSSNPDIYAVLESVYATATP